jgi:cytochrome c oxidase assembly protein subunit 15
VTVLARIAGWRPSPVAVRRAALGALVMNTVIVVTGGAVRLTASGLGCPTWPRCTDASLVATREMGVHGAIEFGNRLLTYVLAAAVGAAILATMRERPRRPDLVRLSWSLLVGIAAQAVLGGVTVLTGLNPVTVMAHFLLSMVLIAAAVLLYERTGEVGGDGVRREVRLAGWALVAVTGVTLFLGTVVTGSGPHSGDRNATHRLPFDALSVTHLHADFVFLLLGLALGVLVAARAADATRATDRLVVLLVVVLAQGTIGFVQHATDLPIALVAAHVLGACLVWIATLRAALALAAGRRPSSTAVEVAAGSPSA